MTARLIADKRASADTQGAVRVGHYQASRTPALTPTAVPILPDPDFAGPHPTCREFVAQLAAWGFTERGQERGRPEYARKGPRADGRVGPAREAIRLNGAGPARVAVDASG